MQYLKGVDYLVSVSLPNNLNGSLTLNFMRLPLFHSFQGCAFNNINCMGSRWYLLPAVLITFKGATFASFLYTFFLIISRVLQWRWIDQAVTLLLSLLVVPIVYSIAWPIPVQKQTVHKVAQGRWIYLVFPCYALGVNHTRPDRWKHFPCSLSKTTASLKAPHKQSIPLPTIGPFRLYRARRIAVFTVISTSILSRLQYIVPMVIC